MRRNLADAPDVLARIRTAADPLKAQRYDRESISGGKSAEAPDPVSADLLDAGDALMTILWSAAKVIRGGVPVGAYRINPAASVEYVYSAAENFARQVLAELNGGREFIGPRLEFMAPLAAAVLDYPDDSDEWSLAKALRRWPVADMARNAKESCPSCKQRTVRVAPPRRAGDPIAYWCRSCDWELTAADSLNRDECALAAGKSLNTIYRWEQRGWLHFIDGGVSTVALERAKVHASSVGGRPRKPKREVVPA